MSSFTSRLEVTPLDDGRRWQLIRGFNYYIGEEGGSDYVLAPTGFVTDFASVPRLFWPIVSPWGRWGKAAIIHDRLYQFHKKRRSFEDGGTGWGVMLLVTRGEADGIFLEAMTVLGVKPWRRKLMYWAVRAFGWIAWNKSGTRPYPNQ